MGKVDNKVKREANSEFPPWDYVLYKDQTKDYFKIVRKLNGEGFNPKCRNPSLRLATKARGCKVVGQEGVQRV